MNFDFDVIDIGEFIEVTDYVANGSFASLRENVEYKDSPDYAVLVRLTDYNSGWSGDFVYVTEGAYKFLRKSRVEPGDVIISNVGANAGTVFRAPNLGMPMTLGPNSVLLKPKENYPYIRDYIYYFFISTKGQNLLQSLLSGSAQPKFNKTDLRNSKIDVPKDRNFGHLVTLLSALDNKIELNRQINQTLEQIAQTIFNSWFVDFEPVKAKIAAKQNGEDPERAAMCAISGKTNEQLNQLSPEQFQQLATTAALFPDELEESELGEIPKGWEFRKVETLLSRLPAKIRYTKNEVKPYGAIPVIEQGAAVILGYHDGIAQYNASPDAPIFIFGDHTCVTYLSLQPFDISQNVIALKGKDRSTLWVFYAVKDKQVFQEYRRHWMELTSKDVVVAPTAICEMFSNLIKFNRLRIETHTRQNCELSAIRDSLLPKLLSGELEIKMDL